MKIACLFVALTLIGGCVNRERLTRQECLELRKHYDNYRSRLYSNVTAEEVLNAVDNLFRMADDGYEVTHSDKGCMAKRRWFLYLVLAFDEGVDYWYVSTENVDNQVKVTIRSTTQSSAYTASPSPSFGPQGNTSWGVDSHTVTSAFNPDMFEIKEMRNREALYNLFFMRLDYLLGKRDTWVKCYEGAMFAKENKLKGNQHPLCLCADDRVPDGANLLKIKSAGYWDKEY